MKFKNITLEVSLKPFWDLSEKGIRRVCETIYFQWHPLFKDIENISVMFLSADGSEILEYKGNLDDSFEWAKYIGVANPEVFGNIPDLPREKLSIHHSPRLYRENPPEFKYRNLKRILEILKAVFAEKGRKVRVGTIFDPGPEFAVSAFKYKRHREICMAGTLGKKSFVCCYAEMNADPGTYAGFPEGVEQGTPFGRFLGRQARHFCSDIGFDYLWLSNGFGFGCETWGICGAVFNGVVFNNAKCGEVRDKILKFWKEFRKELPELPVETRGTNLSTGMDLTSDAVPLADIYRKASKISPPPNSPWAAINGDFGMELTGWMSHIAEIPSGQGYPYRFYIHDPWFINSPWLDRYGRNPHDIYLPMAISRIDEKGKVMNPERISFLSIDNSFGEMPEQVPEEVIPHLKNAARTAPDEAGPVIWLYPFDEYHDMTFSGENLEEVFFGDWFMRTAVNTGFQINTVVSTANFQTALSKGAFLKKVIVVPTAVARNAIVFDLLKKYITGGGKVLFYGPAEKEELLKLLGLKTAPPMSGELEMRTEFGTFPARHDTVYSGGAINTIPDGITDIYVLASARKDGENRTFALTRSEDSWNNGCIAWVRGSNSLSVEENGKSPIMLDRCKYFYSETLMRVLLGKLGYTCEFDKYSGEQPEPVIVTHYNRNGLYFSAYLPDITVAMKLKFPEGAPVFTETESIIEKGMSIYHLPKAPHFECRVFVDMPDGLVKCKEATIQLPEEKRRIEVKGLKNAVLRFRPETGTESTVKIFYKSEAPPYFKIKKVLKMEQESGFAGKVLACKNISGDITIIW
ncbi:MAG: hypothetical protein JW957_04445 [Candidatus Omnitrophica bacterium]|nr:hypothetical protein [Candidatus Omnitrophota bacterium]